MIQITRDISIGEGEVTFRFFTASGPGGQNVNRVATAAHLRFDAASSPSLTEDVVRRLRVVAGRRMSADGVLQIRAQRYRSQDRNRDDALDRLKSLLRQAAEGPHDRFPTRPSRSSVERRLEGKSHRAETKRKRGPVRDDEG